MIRPFDELYHYFRLGLEIMRRIARSLEKEDDPAGALYRSMQEHELTTLAEFYDREISVAAERAVRQPVVVDVTLVGLVPDGETDNRPALEALLRIVGGQLPAVLEFPAGVYRFSAASIPGAEARRAAICLQGLNGLTLRGRGAVTFVVDGTTGPGSIYVENCCDLQLRDLTLDMEPLPFTTGTVVASDPGNSTFEMELAPGERPAGEPFFVDSNFLRGKLHDPETGRLYRREGDLRVTEVERVGPRRYRLKVARNDLSSPPGLTAEFRKGLAYVLHARSDGNSRGNGIEILSSRHVLFRNVRIHAAGLHAAVVRESAGVQFIDCAIEPAGGRLALNTADAFHIPGNRKGLYLERCTVDRSNDDCINFYTRAHPVLRVGGSETLAIPPAPPAAFRPGDMLALIDPNSGQIDAVSSIEDVRAGRWRDAMCSELVLCEPLPGIEIHSRDSTGRGTVRGREYVASGGQTYRDAMAIAAPFEHFVVNVSVKNDGFIVRNCRMGYNRATGFKCKASNGIIENWDLLGAMGVGLSLKVGLDWKEGFYPHNILLDNCRLGTRRPVVVYGGLPGGKSLRAEDMPWLCDIEARNVWDQYGRYPIDLPSPIKTIPL